MLPVVALLIAQASAWTVSPIDPTVGDTVRVVRRIVSEPGDLAQVELLAGSDLVEPLADPTVAYTEGDVVVSYTLAVFGAGLRAIAMPDLQLVRPDGRVDLVFGDTAWVDVVSVLPNEDSLQVAKPALDPLGRRITRPELFALPILAAVAILTAWSLARRRRSARPTWEVGPSHDIELPLQDWVGSGEARAVVAAVTGRLRARIEDVAPVIGRNLSTAECVERLDQLEGEWPVRDLQSTLRALDRARFAPAVPTDLVSLVENVDKLIGSLRPPPTVESD